MDVELTREAAESHVRDVGDPFEVADGHAAGVDEKVREDDLAARQQLPLGRERHGSVGGLDDQGRADAWGVGLGDLALDCGRNEDIAVRLEDGRAIGDEARAGEPPEAARAGAVLGERSGAPGRYRTKGRRRAR